MAFLYYTSEVVPNLRQGTNQLVRKDIMFPDFYDHKYIYV